jgi:hypothetical protein
MGDRLDAMTEEGIVSVKTPEPSSLSLVLAGAAVLRTVVRALASAKGFAHGNRTLRMD